MIAAEKVRVAADAANIQVLRAAVEAIIDRSEKWQGAGMPFSALGDELLLVLAEPLGLRLVMGRFAQIVDLDEEG
jgi:hypothetical protein